MVQLVPTSLNFGTVQVGTSSTQSVTLTNVGTFTLEFGSISITGANASDFTQTNTCVQNVLTGFSCTITVVFTPSAVGSRSANVSIVDDGGGSPQTVPLSGTGQ